MNMKRLTVSLFILFAAIGGSSSVAQASVAPVYALDNLFAALNQGQMEQALAAFDDSASATYAISAQSFAGLDEIDGMLAGWVGNSRTYDIVYVEMAGDQVTARVDVADHGQVWAQQTIVATVAPAGKLLKLDVASFSLQLHRISTIP